MIEKSPNTSAMVGDRRLLDRLFLSAAEVGKLLGYGRSTILQWSKEGLLPEPMNLGNRPRFRTAEIIDWVNSGAPPRDVWHWLPSFPVRLSDLVRLKMTQIQELERELRDLQEQCRIGRDAVHARRHQ